MQIFARCGAAVGTLVLDCAPSSTVDSCRQLILTKLHANASPSELWLQHRGRPCDGRQTLAGAGVRAGHTLDVHLRVRGGGGDGGATGAESRASYLEMYMEKKPDKVDPFEEKKARWTSCKLSAEPLAPPCVADELGSLYNKNAIVTALLNRSLPRAYGHISSLRHVFDVHLEPSADSDEGKVTNARNFQQVNGARFCCPITGQEMNGRYRFVVLRNSGHVVSEKALKQVPEAVREHVGGAWSKQDVIPLYGTTEEVEALWDALMARRAAQKAKKLAKKAAAVGADGLALQEVAAAAMAYGHKRAADAGHAGDGAAAVKKLKATAAAPPNATSSVYASIFTSSLPPTQETYTCRNLSASGRL